MNKNHVEIHQDASNLSLKIIQNQIEVTHATDFFSSITGYKIRSGKITTDYCEIDYFDGAVCIDNGKKTEENSVKFTRQQSSRNKKNKIGIGTECKVRKALASCQHYEGWDIVAKWV